MCILVNILVLPRKIPPAQVVEGEDHQTAGIVFVPSARPVRYFDNIVYCDNLSNIAIRYFLLAITITATEIVMC